MIVNAMTARQHTLSCDRALLEEWKVTMRTSNTRAKKFCSTVGRIVMALVVASMIGGMSVTPAFARDDNRGRGHEERGRHEPRGHYRGHEPRGYYQEPVYAPPPVVYAPQPYQSPGISLVFPIHIR